MNLTPLHDHLIVQRLDEGEQRVSGIIVPHSAKEKPQRGTVFGVGQGKVKEDGSRQPPDVKSGDTILFGKSTRARRSRSMAGTTSSCAAAHDRGAA